jgi:hypothetical protein
MASDFSEKDLLNRLDTMVKVNLDLVGHRMGWLLVSQSFLFTAFALAAAHVHSPSAVPALRLIVWLVPLIGIAVAALVGISIAAAIWVLWEIKGTRRRLEARLLAPYAASTGPSSVPRHSIKDWLGHLPALVLPLGFVGAWILVKSG